MSTVPPDPSTTHVFATAGHVDHGKSALVRALTGMEPDRFAEERRRGMTIDLGYAWTTTTAGHRIAFVDVPGHQRFIANMLAGLGPAPAVLFVVAADSGWSRQSSEHLAAVDALCVQHGVLAITKSDTVDPGRVLAESRQRLAGSSLADIEAVAVSAVTGAGLDRLRAALDRVAYALSPGSAPPGSAPPWLAPPGSTGPPVRLWVDRSFTVRGAGAVATGTLSQSVITLGDQLTLRDRTVTVRGMQAFDTEQESVRAVSRVALNLRGVETADVRRGDVLLTPGAFLTTEVVDARLSTSGLHGEFVLHVGTAAVGVRVRPLGAAGIARLTMSRPLPLRAGDRAVLRDPGRQEVAAGILVLDADVPTLRRRGAAAARGVELAGATGVPDPVDELRRRGLVERAHLERLGVDTGVLGDTHGWLVDPGTRAGWTRDLPVTVTRWARAHPLDPAMPRAALRQALGVPEVLLDELVAESGLPVRDGRIGRQMAASLGPAEAGLTVLLGRLATDPFAAPERDDLTHLGLGRRELTAAARSGRLLQVADGLVLAPDAPGRAAEILAVLPQPFTLSAARQALGTTRRVAVPLLEHLDSTGVTERVSPTTRRVC